MLGEVRNVEISGVTQQLPNYVVNLMQFDWFLSVLEQKRPENHDIYYIGAAE